jgi:hypothetical protein
MLGHTPSATAKPPIRNEILDRRRRMRPFVAALLMLIAIPPIVWTGLAAEFTIRDLSMGRDFGFWDLMNHVASGSILAIIIGFKESLLGTLAIVGGSRLLLRWRFDAIWVSLLLGALVGLTVFDAPSVLLGLDLGKSPAQAIADRTWQGCWPYFGIAATMAAALNWWIVIRPKRNERRAALR